MIIPPAMTGWRQVLLALLALLLGLIPPAAVSGLQGTLTYEHKSLFGCSCRTTAPYPSPPAGSTATTPASSSSSYYQRPPPPPPGIRYTREPTNQLTTRGKGHAPRHFGPPPPPLFPSAGPPPPAPLFSRPLPPPQSPPPHQHEKTNISTTNIVIITLLCVIVVLLLAVIFCLCWYFHNMRRKQRSHEGEGEDIERSHEREGNERSHQERSWEDNERSHQERSHEAGEDVQRSHKGKDIERSYEGEDVEQSEEGYIDMFFPTPRTPGKTSQAETVPPAQGAPDSSPTVSELAAVGARYIKRIEDWQASQRAGPSTTCEIEE